MTAIQTQAAPAYPIAAPPSYPNPSQMTAAPTVQAAPPLKADFWQASPATAYGIDPSLYSLTGSGEDNGSHTITPLAIAIKHSAIMAGEHGVHVAAHAIEHKAASRALSKYMAEHGTRVSNTQLSSATKSRVASQATSKGAAVGLHATEHIAGEALAHIPTTTTSRILSRVVPGVGAAAAGYLAYQSFHHASEASERGNASAAIAYRLSGAVDSVIAAVNTVGAVSGIGAPLSSLASLALGTVATGLAIAGAYLDD